jgi:hypothetical protein
MKITHRGPRMPISPARSKRQSDRSGARRRAEDRICTGCRRFNPAARELQKIAELRTGDELRANKVQQIRDQIDQGIQARSDRSVKASYALKPGACSKRTRTR